jgi:hypothetical protein
MATLDIEDKPQDWHTPFFMNIFLKVNVWHILMPID